LKQYGGWRHYQQEGNEMKILPSGDLEVVAGEGITVKVVKSQRPYAASIADLIGATWETTNKPDDLTEVRSFHAPAAPRRHGSASIKSRRMRTVLSPALL